MEPFIVLKSYFTLPLIPVTAIWLVCMWTSHLSTLDEFKSNATYYYANLTSFDIDLVDYNQCNVALIVLCNFLC